jgi:ferredoxin-NADP reductase
MLHALVRQRSPRPVWWLHGARNSGEHSFATEVEGLLSALPDSHRVICYSNPAPGDKDGLLFDLAGRLTGEVFDNFKVPADADFYLCGPSPFMHDIGAALLARGVTPDRVKAEIFGPSDSITPGVVDSPKPPPHPPDGPPGTGPVVSFSRSNLTVSWDPAFVSLLDLAEACDVPVRWACRTGVCHTCETGLVTGDVSYRPDPLERPASGEVLICCSRPRTDLVVDL